MSAEEERHRTSPLRTSTWRRAGALDVAPCDAIAFEDSASGARAASAAGLVVVAVPSRPNAAIVADLTVSRLDDPRLARYLDLPARAWRAPRSRVGLPHEVT